MRKIVCSYVPPHIIDHIARVSGKSPDGAGAAQRTALAGQLLRDARRAPLGGAADLGAALHTPQPGKGERVIFDDGHQWQLSTSPIRGEDDPPTKLKNANLAYDGLGSTREFYRKELGRDSLDNAGLTLQGHVDFGADFNNAFWDGTEMVFGNGDGQIFKDFTGDVDVIGHELTHGVTQYTAGLQYSDQPGALNEATSDIFGVCVEQFSKNLDAGTFNWLIGEDVMADGLYGEAIRSMAHPGTAYDNPLMGKDPQAADMSQYVPGGDPHVNSGIVNRVFYLVATDLGTFPAAKLWYATLQNLWPTADFAAAADVCAQMARILARDGVIGRQGAQTVRAAFHEVGII
ncbi:M4 family metallopeptidase [Amycolatopsis sp. NPDC051758]|uniref:M4 family metallopeptidase n=1 Tax=Amycolatopsis sp. NPDC051758 TaxID=3363935 RepID=UPI00378B43CC